jgi:hypothetical protein
MPVSRCAIISTSFLSAKADNGFWHSRGLEGLKERRFDRLVKKYCKTFATISRVEYIYIFYLVRVKSMKKRKKRCEKLPT